MCRTLCPGGAASVCIPSASGEYFLDVPLVRTIPSSWIERMAERLGVPTRSEAGYASLRGDKASVFAAGDDWGTADVSPCDNIRDSEWSVVEPGGTVLLRLAVLQTGQ